MAEAIEKKLPMSQRLKRINRVFAFIFSAIRGGLAVVGLFVAVQGDWSLPEAFADMFPESRGLEIPQAAKLGFANLLNFKSDDETKPVEAAAAGTTPALAVTEVAKAKVALAEAEAAVANAKVALTSAAGADGTPLVENKANLKLGAKEPQLALPLTPRMEAALNNISRRYHVSAGPLVSIFAAAESAGREFGLDPLLIVSVIAVESSFNPFSESNLGAQGLMQVMPRFHQDKLPRDAHKLSFFDPELNVRIGARILKESISRHGGLEAGLQQFGGALYDGTQRYANKVLTEKARLESAVPPFRKARAA